MSKRDNSPSELGRELPLTPYERIMWDKLCIGEYARLKSSHSGFRSELVILCRLRKKLKKSRLPFEIVNIRKGFLALERLYG